METVKKITHLLIISTLFLFFTNAIYAQSYTITGYQTKGVAGKNAKLECQAVVIKKAAKIVSITGENNGFWINKGGVTAFRYYKPNDPTAIGLILKPGTYYIYPNLKQNQNKASVIISLK